MDIGPPCASHILRALPFAMEKICHITLKDHIISNFEQLHLLAELNKRIVDQFAVQLILPT